MLDDSLGQALAFAARLVAFKSNRIVGDSSKNSETDFSALLQSTRNNSPAHFDRLIQCCRAWDSQPISGILLLPEKELRKDEFKLLGLGDALFQSKILQEILSTDECKPLSVTGYFIDSLDYSRGEILSNLGCHHYRFSDQNEWTLQSRERRYLVLFTYFAFRSIMTDQRASCDKTQLSNLLPYFGTAETWASSPIQFLGHFVSAYRTIFNFLSGEKQDSGHHLSPKWEIHVYRGQFTWSTWITQQKSIFYTQYWGATRQILSDAETKDHDIVFLELGSDEKANQSLFEEGFSLGKEASPDFHYLLRSVVTISKNGVSTCYHNSLELTDVANPENLTWEIRDPTRIQLCRYSIHHIKNDIKYLIYEKVPKSD